MYRVLYKGSCALLLSLSALNELLWESLNDKFCQFLEQFTQTLYFCRIFADEVLCTGCTTKGAAH